MRLLAAVCACLGTSQLAAASPGGYVEFGPPNLSWLPIEIKQIHDAVIEATILNPTPKALKALKVGTILDPGPVQKADVYSDGKPVPFRGIRYKLIYNDLSNSAFEWMPEDTSKTIRIDLAKVYDLSKGGDFSVVMSGDLPLSEGHSDKNKLTGSIAYRSNILQMRIDGKKIGRFQHLHERLRVKNCDHKRKEIDRVLPACAALASAGGKASRRKGGSAALMKEYFHTTDPWFYDQVLETLHKVWTECTVMLPRKRRPNFSCINEGCTDAMAWTIPDKDHINFCPRFFEIPVTTKECSNQVSIGDGEFEYFPNQAGILVHEMTHLNKIRGTFDFEYGYKNISKLAPKAALMNADTYEYFAHAAENKCKKGRVMGI